MRPHGCRPSDRTFAIRQIAALPYRIEGSGDAVAVRIMLVTSRGTGRWVIPKGNVGPTASLHAAAAAEAEEEAGVCGALCPVPIGAYRYRKRRGSGASLMVDVDVFPLAVTQELDDWKERAERERRWFSLADAAKAVDEADLRELIQSFAPAQFQLAVRQGGRHRRPLGHPAKGNSMFAWFQRLLPKTGNFFELFEAHAATVLAGAEATARLLDGGPAGKEHIREIIEREHDADEITREVLKSVRATFLTPFDRASITALIGSLDDTIDEMQAAAAAIDLYDVSSFAPEMRDMAAIVVDAARLAAEAMPLLRDVTRNGERLHELTERLIRIEGHADEIHAAGLKRSLQEHGATDTLRFVIERELYKHLERIVDAFEDVADEIDGIVIDHA